MGIPVREQFLVEHGHFIVPDDAFFCRDTIIVYSPIYVKVQSLNNAPIDMVIIAPWPIDYLKEQIEQHMNIHPSRQRLLCNRQELKDDKVVSDYSTIIRNHSIITIHQNYTVTLRPSGVTLSVTDHHSVGDIKGLIQNQLNIPQNNQLLFMHNEFQENNHGTFSHPEPNVEAYVVDNRTNTLIVALEFANQHLHAYLLDQSPTDSSLKSLIERDFGYAIEAQHLTVKTEIKSGGRIINGYVNTLSIISQTLFWQLLASSDRSSKSSLVPSDTVEQATDYIANELGVLPYRVSLFSLIDRCPLAEEKHTCASYKLMAGQIIGAEICEPAHRQLRFKLPTGKSIELDIIVDITVHDLKTIIGDQEGIDARCLIILKGDQEFGDDDIIYDCLMNWHDPLHIKIVLSGPLALDANSLAPEFDYDFTDIMDTEVFTRGNHPYERPCGSRRIALNVVGRYGYDDRWLGMMGTDSEEWPVSYHGTGKHNAMSIVEEGFKLSKSDRFKFGRGIYSTPELEVAKLYASEFEHGGEKYCVLFQNRVNPKFLKVISKEETEIGTYWLSSKGSDDTDEDISDLIRPYSVCIFKV